MHLPLRILRAGSNGALQSDWTRNISSGGVLFTAGAEVQIGAMIEYIVTLAETRGVQVDLRCTGKVLRRDQASAEPPTYLIAATLDRYEFIRRECASAATA